MFDKIMNRMTALVAVLSCGFGPAPALSSTPPPTIEQLQEIEAEGRRIVLYFEALAVARDEFERRAPAGAATDRQVIVARRDGWHVLFVIDADPREINDKPDLVAEVVFNPSTSHVRTFHYLENPRRVPGIAADHLLAVEAAEIAAAAADATSPPYEAAIFFEAGQMFGVYLIAAPVDGTIRFGSDFLVTIDRNPVRVTSIEPLHAAAWTVALPDGTSNEPTAHSHLENDLPTATDVALVMIWPALAPHLVLTPNHIFRIEADGTIGYLGSNQPPDAGAGGAE